ncbi:NAD kinase [Streptococcus cuniculipharyngis]|uniref:NAD kinase n=1 Tax=Streptococcus cuniculipharyngis TaxID=1562651 RepID=A0A5C5SFL2_9STRE|nr:NAD kinase [Streptococcus cuniculipharyngis]TWS98918.1 NAD kinase [Streptococcus cuniculipharyngis]
MTQTNFTDKQIKVAIVSNGNYHSRGIAHKLFTTLRDDDDFYLTKRYPDVVISIGGDGMLLSAFHMYERSLDNIRFVGIHTGHLGFYTDYRDFEVDTLLENLRSDKGEKISYPILSVKTTLSDGRILTSRALNEATIKRLEKTMVADVIVNDIKFESFRGDGLSVSTPTGSTAYNKSLGGAVLHPTIEALQLTEIASLNNRVFRTLGSPLIVPKHETIEVIPRRLGTYVITIDNKTYKHRDVVKIEFEIDRKKIHFLGSENHTSFWERVRDAFIGELDDEI